MNATSAQMAPMKAVGKFLREQGLYLFMPKHLMLIVPPLCITREQLEEGLAIIDQALEIADQSAA
jgi:taurine--2-oxoglutarate transaminase